MDFHHHFLLSGFWYSLRCLFCIYRLWNSCQFWQVYHDDVINCKVPLCFLCAVISCTFLSRVWGGVSVRSSEPMDGKNWHFWFYWWLVVKKHHIVKIWQTQEPSANATEGQKEVILGNAAMPQTAIKYIRLKRTSEWIMECWLVLKVLPVRELEPSKGNRLQRKTTIFVPSISN